MIERGPWLSQPLWLWTENEQGTFETISIWIVPSWSASRGKPNNYLRIISNCRRYKPTKIILADTQARANKPRPEVKCTMGGRALDSKARGSACSLFFVTLYQLSVTTVMMYNPKNTRISGIE